MSRASRCIDPPSHRFLGDRLFESAGGRLHSSLARCFVRLRDHLNTLGIAVHAADRLPAGVTSDVKAYVSCGLLRDNDRVARRPDVWLSALLISESPIVEPKLYRRVARARPHFRRLHSCSDDPELARFLGGPLNALPFRWPIHRRGVDEALWRRKERGFLIMFNMSKLPRISRNELFTAPIRAVDFVARHHEIDVYAVGWQRLSVRWRIDTDAARSA